MRTLILACTCLHVLFLAPNVLSQEEEQMPMSNTTLVVVAGGNENMTQSHVVTDKALMGTNTTNNNTANSTDDECGLEVKVGCILTNTAEDDNPVDCNAYVPKTAKDCMVQVRYTYHVDKDDKLSGMKLVSALRYRDGSYWEDQYGNPRPFSESRWDTLLTVRGGYYQMVQWEGEVVNFCQPQSVVTRFDFNVDGSDSAGNSCSRSDSYTLTTAGGQMGSNNANGQHASGNEMANGSSGASTSDAATTSASASFDCPLEIELTCMIDSDGDDNGDIDCNDYDPIASGLPCDAKTIYSHKLHNKAPWNSGIDVDLMEISRTRVGDLPHGDYYDFLDKVLGGSLLLEATYQTTIRELPTINFCQPVQDIYVTTFNTISSIDGGITVCENKAEYTLDMVNRRR